MLASPAKPINQVFKNSLCSKKPLTSTPRASNSVCTRVKDSGNRAGSYGAGCSWEKTPSTTFSLRHALNKTRIFSREMSCKWDCHVHSQIKQGSWLCLLFCKQDDVFEVSVKIGNPAIVLRQLIKSCCLCTSPSWERSVSDAENPSAFSIYPACPQYWLLKKTFTNSGGPLGP